METQAVIKTSLDERKLARLPIVGVGNKIDPKKEKWLREFGTYDFYNLEEPGLMHEFSYGDARNNMRFTFLHGGRYRVPRFIAQHIDSRGCPIYNWRPDGSGSMRKEKTGMSSRFQMREVYE